MQIVIVEWTDAAGSDGAWSENADDLEPARITSVGFLVKDTKRAITLGQSRDDNRPPKFDNLLAIPRHAVTRRVRLVEV